MVRLLVNRQRQSELSGRDARQQLRLLSSTAVTQYGRRPDEAALQQRRG